MLIIKKLKYNCSDGSIDIIDYIGDLKDIVSDSAFENTETITIRYDLINRSFIPRNGGKLSNGIRILKFYINQGNVYVSYALPVQCGCPPTIIKPLKLKYDGTLYSVSLANTPIPEGSIYNIVSYNNCHANLDELYFNYTVGLTIPISNVISFIMSNACENCTEIKLYIFNAKGCIIYETNSIKPKSYLSLELTYDTNTGLFYKIGGVGKFPIHYFYKDGVEIPLPELGSKLSPGKYCYKLVQPKIHTPYKAASCIVKCIIVPEISGPKVGGCPLQLNRDIIITKTIDCKILIQNKSNIIINATIQKANSFSDVCDPIEGFADVSRLTLASQSFVVVEMGDKRLETRVVVTYQDEGQTCELIQCIGWCGTALKAENEVPKEVTTIKRIISGFKTFYDETETSISVLIKQPVITKYSVTCENKASVINITEVKYGDIKPSPGDFPFTLHCWADYTGGFDKFGIPISKPDVIYTAVTKFPHKITNFYFSKEAIVMAIDSAGNRSQPVRVNQIKGCYCFDFTYKYLCDKDTLTITLLAQGTYFVYVNDKLVIGDAKVNANGTLTIPNLGLLYGDKQTHTIKIVGYFPGKSCTIVFKIHVETCALICTYDCEKGLICTGKDNFEIIEIVHNTGKEESLGVFSSKDSPIYLISNSGFETVIRYRIINTITKAYFNIIDIGCCEYSEYFTEVNQDCEKLVFSSNISNRINHKIKFSILDILSGIIVATGTSTDTHISVSALLSPNRRYKYSTEDLTYKSKPYKNKKAPYCENEGQLSYVRIIEPTSRDAQLVRDFKTQCLSVERVCNTKIVKPEVQLTSCNATKFGTFFRFNIIIKGYSTLVFPNTYLLEYIDLDSGVAYKQEITFVLNSTDNCEYTARAAIVINTRDCKNRKKGILIKYFLTTQPKAKEIPINHTITAAEIKALCCPGLREDIDQ